MTDKPVRDVARRFLGVWSAGQLHLLDELAADDIVVRYTHFPQAVRGRTAFRVLLENTFMSFPDLTISGEEPIVEGDRAVVRWTYMGTHKHGELFGVRPSDRRVTVSGITCYRIIDGRVVEESGIVDNLALLQQLGVALG
jgi:steroid delta-isomerase-like uncharacterized protein